MCESKGLGSQISKQEVKELERKGRELADPRNNPASPGSPDEVAVYKGKLREQGILYEDEV